MKQNFLSEIISQVQEKLAQLDDDKIIVQSIGQLLDGGESIKFAYKKNQFVLFSRGVSVGCDRITRNIVKTFTRQINNPDIDIDLSIWLIRKTAKRH